MALVCESIYSHCKKITAIMYACWNAHGLISAHSYLTSHNIWTCKRFRGQLFTPHGQVDTGYVADGICILVNSVIMQLLVLDPFLDMHLCYVNAEPRALCRNLFHYFTISIRFYHLRFRIKNGCFLSFHVESILTIVMHISSTISLLQALWFRYVISYYLDV